MKKYIIFACVLVMIMGAAFIMIFNTNRQSVQLDQPVTQDAAVEENATVPNTTSASIHENESDVAVIESTPDSVKIEVSNEDGQKFDVELGGTSDSGLKEESETSKDKPTQTQPTTPPVTQPDNQTSTSGSNVPTHINDATGPDRSMTYEEYEAMSAENQLMFYYSFANHEDFQAWYNAAKAEHDANSGDIIVGSDGVVNVGGNG